jgi:hypothetical protein
MTERKAAEDRTKSGMGLDRKVIGMHKGGSPRRTAHRMAPLEGLGSMWASARTMHLIGDGA